MLCEINFIKTLKEYLRISNVLRLHRNVLYYVIRRIYRMKQTREGFLSVRTNTFPVCTVSGMQFFLYKILKDSCFIFDISRDHFIRCTIKYIVLLGEINYFMYKCLCNLIIDEKYKCRESFILIIHVYLFRFTLKGFSNT